MGYGVAVVEKKETIDRRVCCTGIVGKECVSVFGIENNVILRQVNSARLFSPSGKGLRLSHQGTQACVLDRPAFNQSWVKRAQSQKAEYFWGGAVQDIQVNDKSATIRAIYRGESLNLQARAIVVASGFGSAVVRKLGMGSISDFVAGAQAEVETRQLDEVEVYFGQEIAPGFFGWLVPTSPSRALVGLLSRRSPSRYLNQLILSLRHQGKIVAVDSDFGCKAIPLKPLPRTYGNRLLMVGDTAGQVKPTTGGGIYYGLLCADIAARTLHRALQVDSLSARSLSTYEREWKKKLATELRIGYWLRRLYERLDDGQIDRIFDLIDSNGIARAILETNNLSFDWHGKSMLRAIGHRALLPALGIIRLPFRLTKG